MIKVEGLSKDYRVHQRSAGLAASLNALFRREYKTVNALSDISFDIPPGEFVGILGPNGAGKTTCMKLLSGLLYPTVGRVTVAGFVPSERKREFLRKIALVMGQKNQLYWDLPPSDSFLLHKAIYDIDERDFSRRLGEMAGLLKVEGVLKKQVRKLSLGERMKCEVILSLLHYPRVVFLDEPTIGLDVEGQESIRNFLKEYSKANGATILLTSHYMKDVAELTDRIIVIDNGTKRFDDSKESLKKKASGSKVIKLRFAGATRFGHVDACRLIAGDDFGVELEVDSENVAEVTASLMKRYLIDDVSIEEPPLENLLADLVKSR